MRESWRELIRPPSPGAGSPFTKKVTSRAFERPLIVRASFTTGAVVGNREPWLRFLDGDGAVFAHFRGILTLAANNTQFLTFADGYAQSNPNGANDGTVEFATTLLPAGFSFQLGMDNIQAADTITTISVWEEFVPTGELAEPIGSAPYRSYVHE